MVAPITHRDLAEALGSAREVVTRALRELQRDGAVGSVRGGIEILDGRKLAAIAGAWWAPTNFLWLDPRSAEETFERSDHAVIGVDARGGIVYANPAAGRTFGAPPRGLLGWSLAALLPSEIGAGFAALLGPWMAEARPGPIGLGRGFHGRRADGSEFPAEITLLPRQTPSGAVVFARVVDVSYREVLRSLLAGRAAAAQAGAPVIA
jgi:PAS domain S-box-containing protein